MTDEITQFTEILKNSVDEKRFRHSLGVMNEAETLAERHGADKNKAKIAGLLHDITKNLSVPEHLSLIRAHSPNEDPEESSSRDYRANCSAQQTWNQRPRDPVGRPAAHNGKTRFNAAGKNPVRGRFHRTEPAICRCGILPESRQRRH